MSITICVPNNLRRNGKTQNRRLAATTIPKNGANGNGSCTQRYALTEFKHGPDPKGPQRCIRCHREFKRGDNWVKVWDEEHRYAIGRHDACQ